MPVTELLAQRRAEIEAEIKKLRAELGQIRAAEEAIASMSGEMAPAPRSRRASGSANVRAGSIKDWIIKALTDHPAGLETEGVIDAVEKLGGPQVPRNSMTPQLSRLKASGYVALDGRLWRRVWGLPGLQASLLESADQDAAEKVAELMS
jgi:hypothetical protein